MSLEHYWDALFRLKTGKPEKAKAGYKINLNTVALEAGRKPGSIKKSRNSHLSLIEAIKNAANERANPTIEMKNKLSRQVNLTKSYKEKYHEALNREIIYLDKIAELFKTIEQNNH